MDPRDDPRRLPATVDRELIARTAGLVCEKETKFVSSHVVDRPPHPSPTNRRVREMNVDQHLKVAQWHIEKARLHATEDGYKCGCPINDEHKKAIDEVEAGLVKIEKPAQG